MRRGLYTAELCGALSKKGVSVGILECGCC